MTAYPGPDDVTRRLQADADPAVRWHWRDYRNPAPRPGWDGRHELSVRGYGTVDEVAGVTLACSCGREARVAEPPDWSTNPRRYEPGGDDGQIALNELNAIAAAHVASTPVPVSTCGECAGGLIAAGVRCNCDPGPEGQHHLYCGFETCPNGCWEKLHPLAGGTS